MFIFLALLTTFSAAEIEDFSAVSQNKALTACSCSVLEDSINIKNTGRETSIYSLTGEGETKDWITFYPDSLILEPGQEAFVNSYIKPPCNIKGNFDVKILITTGNGLRKQLLQEVSVNKCLNFDLELKSFNNTGCPCSFLFYEFEVKNTGSFYDVYNLGMEEPFAKWATLTANKIGLPPGETSSFLLYMNTPCTSSGNYIINLDISSESNQIKASYPLKINTLSCFDYSLKLGDYVLKEEEYVFKEHPSSVYSLCEQEIKIVPLLIENKADKANIYSFTLHGKSWASLEKEELRLNKTQNGIVNLILSPEKIENKNYSFTLNVNALNGGLLKEGEFSVNLEKCYLPAIASSKKIKINYSETKTPITIENRGNKDAIYSFFMEGEEDWVKIEPSSLAVDSNGEGTMYLHTLPDSELKQGNYELTINVLVNQSKQYYQEEIKVELRKPGVLSKISGMLGAKALDVLSFVKQYYLYFIGSLVLLIALIVILSIIVNRRKIEKTPELPREEEEKAELKKKPKIEKKIIEEATEEKIEKERLLVKKIVPYSFGVIILAAVIFFGIKYKIAASIFGVLKAYLKYIIIGFVSLIVLVVVLNLIRSRMEPGEPKPEIKKEKAEIKKKPKKEKKIAEDVEEEKLGFKKIIIYSLIIIILGIVIFFAFRFLKKPAPEDIAMNVSSSVNATSLGTALDAVKMGLMENVNKLIEFSKGLIGKIYALIKPYILSIVMGFAALFTLILTINIIKKKKKTIKKSAKAIKSKFTKTKKLVRKHKFKKQITSIFLIVIILSVLALAGYYSAKTVPYIIEKVKNMSLKENITEEEFIFIPLEEKGIETQVWDEDKTHKIDLSKYFHDPDNDQLFYSSTAVENITITIDNTTAIAVLKPEQDWHGKAAVIFTADDRKGGVIKSNNVTLIVRDVSETFLGNIFNSINLKLSNANEFASKQTRQLKEYFMMYIGYIIVGLSILLLIILFLRFKKQILDFLEEENIEELEKEEKEEKKKPEKKRKNKVNNGKEP